MKRALCAWPLSQLEEPHLAVLRDLERHHDELILIVTDADEAYTPAMPLSAGERIARALPLLRAQLKCPFYLLPVKRGASRRRSMRPHPALRAALSHLRLRA